jgi:hypothetical protein
MIAAVRNLLDPQPGHRIFPYSYRTFFARFHDVVAALGLPKVWTPASLRSGGATYLYRAGAAVDWIRLRGRWRTLAALEHYIQEAVSFLTCCVLPSACRCLVLSRAELVSEALVALVTEWQTAATFGHNLSHVDYVFKPHKILRRLRQRTLQRELRTAMRADIVDHNNT